MKNQTLRLVIGDLHYREDRSDAIKIAEESILATIQNKQFNTIILLGDLFDKKPTDKERVMLANFLNRLRKHTNRFDFIIGNGKHTFEKDTIHEQDWIDLCSDFFQHEELKIDKFCFGHYEVKGTKYINGHLSDSEKEVSKDLTYILGHIHSPGLSFNNINYVGSIYKVSFSEIADEKRIALLEDNKLSFLPITSKPMHLIDLYGNNGKVSARGFKQIKDKNIDLKIRAITDSISIQELQRNIYKIKNYFNVEYYQEEIKIQEIKSDIPKSLNQLDLLKDYCTTKKINFNLVEKEIGNDRSYC